MCKSIQQQPTRFSGQSVLKGWYGRTLLVSVAALMLLCAGPAYASGHGTLRLRARELQDSGASPPPPPSANETSPAVDGTLGNATTPSPPPPVSTPPPPAPKGHKAWDEGKSAAEKGIAITVGVLMLVSILTCLVCCVFRRGGQWRVPGMEWFKKKFGQKDKYARYVENQDDGF